MQEKMMSFSANTVADYYRQHGYQIVKTESCWWFNEYHQKYIYYSFPGHRQIIPSEAEFVELFDRLPSAIALRYISPPGDIGNPSCLWVCRGPYGLDKLKKKNRNQTRRGIEQCSVRKITFAELLEKGWKAHVDTNKRHGKKTHDQGFDGSLDGFQAYEAWGAFCEGSLLAYLVILLVDDWAYIIINRSTNSSLKYYPNNALVFQVVLDLLSRETITAVSYGWDPLVSNPGLDVFKSGMGFVKESVSQRIVIRPKYRKFINNNWCKLVADLLPRKRLPYRLQQLIGLCEIVAAN